MKNYHKGNITLQIRVPAALAISILGRLYGCGLMTKDEYMQRVEKISVEKAENEKRNSDNLSRLLEKASEKGAFFNKK